MATLDEALDILDKLRASNDSRYDSYRAMVQQGLDSMPQPEVPPYQPPPGPHQLPSQTDYLRGLTHGDDWQSGQGTVRRALAPVMELGQRVGDWFSPPTQEEIVNRPFVTQSPGVYDDKLHALQLQREVLGQQGPPTSLGAPPGSVPSFSDDPGPYFEGPQMSQDFQLPITDGMGMPDMPYYGKPIEQAQRFLRMIPHPVTQSLSLIPDIERMIPGTRQPQNAPISRALASGVSDLVSAVPTTVEMGAGALGADTVSGYAGDIARYLDEGTRKQFGDPTPLAQKSVVDDPSVLKNFNWWAENIARFLPSILPGIGAAKGVGYLTKGMQSKTVRSILAKSAFGTVAGGQEAAGTYKNVIGMGYSPEVARDAASTMFFGSAILNAIGSAAYLNPMDKNLLNRFITGYFLEGTTEGLEEYVDAIGIALATGNEADFNSAFKHFVDVFLQAGVVGGGGAATRRRTLDRSRSEVLAEQSVIDIAKRFNFNVDHIVFSTEQLFDNNGELVPSLFDKGIMTVHVPTMYEMSDGTKSGVEAAAAEFTFHENIHLKFGALSKALKEAIYDQNKDAIERWIASSLYKNDNLSNIGKTDEWIANNSEKDYRLFQCFTQSTKF